MQVQKCDQCNAIGEPGETWVTVSVTPFYIRGNQQFYDDDMLAMPSGPRGGTTCSPACALARLRRGFEDQLVFAERMTEGLDQLLEKHL